MISVITLDIEKTFIEYTKSVLNTFFQKEIDEDNIKKISISRKTICFITL